MNNKGTLTFVTGGSGSGKSRFAERLVAGQNREVVYVATCRTDALQGDAELQERIHKHRIQRPAAWETIENEMDLIALASRCAGRVVLLDCLTLWLSDAMGEGTQNPTIVERLETGLQAMQDASIDLVIVSNEIGCGIVPLGQGLRQYRDLVGLANQCVAARSNDVYWVVAGIPIQLKHKGKPCALNTVES
jgi:adenosylcobinamide kinase / adenosylcobinamide-phosphate guanylyltransferase